jgi:hypothetical protein
MQCRSGAAKSYSTARQLQLQQQPSCCKGFCLRAPRDFINHEGKILQRDTLLLEVGSLGLASRSICCVVIKGFLKLGIDIPENTKEVLLTRVVHSDFAARQLKLPRVLQGSLWIAGEISVDHSGQHRVLRLFWISRPSLRKP